MPHSGREQLVAYVKRTKLMQKDLAPKLKITGAYLSQILSGARRPSLTIAARIQELTGISASSWTLRERANKKNKSVNTGDEATEFATR